MASSRTFQYALGVALTARTVHAVLLEQSANGPKVVRRMKRQRSGRTASVGQHAHAAAAWEAPVAVPEGASGSDFTIDFGDGSGSDDMFLGAEFTADAKKAVTDSASASAPRPQTFPLELLDILSECRDQGYDPLPVAIVLSPMDTASVEVRLAASKKGDLPPRTKLFETLRMQVADVQEDRTGFIPMTPGDDGLLRVLALSPGLSDPVIPTLEEMRRNKGMSTPMARLLEPEMSLFYRLVQDELRETNVPADNHTLVVRTAEDHTFVFILRGETLLHSEILRSLTAFDPADTICSRILLLLDEHGITEVGDVLILAEERETELAGRIEGYFADANVRSISDFVDLPEAGDKVVATDVAAIVAASDLIDSNIEADLNLLPPRLMRRKMQLPMNWPALVIGILLIVSVAVFVVRYQYQDVRIKEYERLLAQYPPQSVDLNPRVLQARIDSLRGAYQGYTRALTTLDGLLIGSDRWSRTLDRLATETAATRGIWVDNWRPDGENMVLAGNSNTRERIVDLATRLEGVIEALSFSEIRDYPVYSFTMRIPAPVELPEAAVFLREQALVDMGGDNS
jgi:hypothetical protein